VIAFFLSGRLKAIVSTPSARSTRISIVISSYSWLLLNGKNGSQAG
jgi:hypothetical protein